MTRQSALGIAESTLVVAPVTALWMLLAPWMLILASMGEWWTRYSTPGISTFTLFWLTGGMVGIGSLWLSTFNQETKGIRSGWLVAGLLVGIAVSLSVFFGWQAGWLGFRMPDWLPWALLLPVIVAIRRIAGILVTLPNMTG